jgi:hypothetical protein
MSVNENKFQEIIQKIKDNIGSFFTPSTSTSSPNCVPNTNLFPTEDQTILDLENKIKGYKMWLIGIGIFIVFVILTKIFNPFQLTTQIIYIIISTIIFFICVTMLIKMFLNVKNGIATTESNPISKIVYIIGAVSTFIIILITIFSNEFKQNKALSLNYFVLFAVLVLTCFAFIVITKDDDIAKKNLPRDLQMFYNERSKYTSMFILFILVISMLYFYDPWNIMTKYIGISTFLVSSVGLMIFLMIFVYHYFFTHPSKSGFYGESPTLVKLLTRGIYILGAMGVSGLLIYGILSWIGAFKQNSYTSDTIGSTALNIIMLIGMLAIIWKLVNSGGYLEENPVFRLILNTILYIPCLVVNIIDYFTGQYKQTKQTEMMMLLLGLGIFGGFFLIKFLLYPYASTKYYGQGGKSWINEPIPTDKQSNVATYQDLNKNVNVDANANAPESDLQNSTEKYNYQYAMSFWFYLDSFGPSTTSINNKVPTILSYGENPCVKYDVASNTIYITVKNDGDNKIGLHKPRKNITGRGTIDNNNNITEGFSISDIRNKIEEIKTMPMEFELDSMGNRIIYKQPNVLLQKWNNIIINYKGGTLDVFYNGELVKSAIEVVPYMKFDMLTVGSDGGASGNVANLVYFDEPINYLQVHTLYNSLKNSNPPIIPGSGKTIIQQIKNSI